jgi:hypothetical protein
MSRGLRIFAAVLCVLAGLWAFGMALSGTLLARPSAGIWYLRSVFYGCVLVGVCLIVTGVMLLGGGALKLSRLARPYLMVALGTTGVFFMDAAWFAFHGDSQVAAWGVLLPIGLGLLALGMLIWVVKRKAAGR